MQPKTKKEKEQLAAHVAHDRPLDALESMVISQTNDNALQAYKMGVLHTMELITERNSRPGSDVPLDARLANHIHGLASTLFHFMLREAHPRDEESVDRTLDDLVASVYAYKVLMSREKVQSMMSGTTAPQARMEAHRDT